MKLEEIFELWEKDSKIDNTELGAESLKIPQLHHKYFKIFSNERLVLRKLEQEMKKLRMAKFEFYTQGPTQETDALGWKLPEIGRIIKSDVHNYIESDDNIVQLALKISLQYEKVDLLESIIKSLNGRGFNIKTAVDYLKFTSGY